MNTYVTFEQAKLLKEKGFLDKNIYGEVRLSQSHFYDCKGNLYHIKDAFIEQDFNLKDCYNAPEQHQVVEWLRVNHSIWVYVDTHEYGKWCFNYKIIKPNKDYPRINVNGEFGLEDYNSPQEAYSAAFDYILKELI
jgi:hypothetical protein